ncbi:MAG: hypothetical protein ACLQVY_19780 [Limisphaerales bacterium]
MKKTDKAQQFQKRKVQARLRDVELMAEGKLRPEDICLAAALASPTTIKEEQRPTRAETGSGPRECPTCKVSLHTVKANEPWHDDYLICPQCDSTFNLWAN